MDQSSGVRTQSERAVFQPGFFRPPGAFARATWLCLPGRRENPVGYRPLRPGFEAMPTKGGEVCARCSEQGLK